MNNARDKTISFLSGLIIFTVIAGVLCISMPGPLKGAEITLPGDVVTDPLGVASFVYPRGWVRWDYWGLVAFSPTSQHTPRITFAVTSGDFSTADRADKAMRDYTSAFSTENYTLIQKENLYLGGWWGVRILAQGTEKNTLFGRDYIWIQEYFTKNKKISLVFRSDPASFETYRDAVLRSFRSLTISER